MAKKKLKDYRVACNHIDHGWVYVTARNEEEAEEKADKKLEMEGATAIEKVMDREWMVVSAEEE